MMRRPPSSTLFPYTPLFRPRLHVEKPPHDDPADIAQPDLARHFPRRLEVGAQDRALGVAFAGVAARVHVDRDERLGRLDDEIAAGRKVDALLEEIADLRLDEIGRAHV